MATYMNFTTLRQDVTNYLERGASPVTDETVYAQIPRLINAAERKIMQALKLQGTLEVLNNPTGFSPGTSVIPKPDRWRQTVSISFGKGENSNERTPIYPRSYEYCRKYWPDDSVRGVPKFYADYNYQNWLFVPTSDATYPIEILCYMQPPLLDETNQTNFWTDYTPTLLLYSTLLESAPFLKNDDRIPVWQGLRDFEFSTLVPQDLQKILDRAAERNNP